MGFCVLNKPLSQQSESARDLVLHPLHDTCCISDNNGYCYRNILYQLTSCQWRCSSIIRRRVAIASAMFTRRAGAGSAEARRARANGAWIEAWRAGVDEGQSRDCGGWKMQHCHFIAPALSRKHRCQSCWDRDNSRT